MSAKLCSAVQESRDGVMLALMFSPARLNMASILDLHHDQGTDFAEVKGRENVKRASGIATAGGHPALTLRSITAVPPVFESQEVAGFAVPSLRPPSSQ